MHTAGNMAVPPAPAPPVPQCSPAFTGTPNKATLFLKQGQIKETGGLLRMCYTTLMSLGGDSTGCVPLAATYPAAPALVPGPTLTPCPGLTMGDGQFKQTGGGIDWTAPNQYDVMTLADGSPDPALAPAWSDINGPEDLALWSESGGDNSGPLTYSMAGGGLFNVRGVFMVPNADSVSLAGGALLDLTNAQFIATSLSLDGNTTRVKMAVDPNSAVTMPDLNPFTLVR